MKSVWAEIFPVTSFVVFQVFFEKTEKAEKMTWRKHRFKVKLEYYSCNMKMNLKEGLS